MRHGHGGRSCWPLGAVARCVLGENIRCAYPRTWRLRLGLMVARQRSGTWLRGPPRHHLRSPFLSSSFPSLSPFPPSPLSSFPSFFFPLLSSPSFSSFFLLFPFWRFLIICHMVILPPVLPTSLDVSSTCVLSWKVGKSPRLHAHRYKCKDTGAFFARPTISALAPAPSIAGKK